MTLNLPNETIQNVNKSSNVNLLLKDKITNEEKQIEFSIK